MSREELNGTFGKWALGLLQVVLVIIVTWIAKETNENGKKIASMKEQIRLLENQVFRLQQLDDRRSFRSYEQDMPSEYRPLPNPRE